MAIQRYSGAFRIAFKLTQTFPPPIMVNLLDTYPAIGGTGATPGWSTGATLVDQLQLSPPMIEQWTLQQVSISAQLLLAPDAGNIGPIYGKLGKILAGLAVGTTQTNGDAFYANFDRLVQLPADRTALTTLWDPANDPLPSTQAEFAGPSYTVQPLYVSATVSPPFPLKIAQGESIGVGLWMLPSLIGIAAPNAGADWQMIVSDAEYAVIYDDGINPPPPGYS